MKAFSQERKEIKTYSDRMQHVLDLATKESLARGIFYGMVSQSLIMIGLNKFYNKFTFINMKSRHIIHYVIFYFILYMNTKHVSIPYKYFLMLKYLNLTSVLISIFYSMFNIIVEGIGFEFCDI